MTNKHKELYEKAEKAINDLFSDTSVEPAVTIEDLQSLIDDLQIKIETLK